MSRPSAPALLQTARQTLFSHLLPALPRELQYEARMIANAMIIAVREQQMGDACTGQEREYLQSLLDSGQAALPPQELRRQLSLAIREGKFDQHDTLPARLLQITRSKLAISNPKAVRN